MDQLTASEKKFTKKLCDSMIPPMIDAFWEIWLEAKKESKGKNVTLVFQELLRGIKSWNSSISQKHAEAIKNRFSLSPKILNAVFICHVKILLSGIRMDKRTKKVSIKLPSYESFVQNCYVSCGEDLYYRPEVISGSHSDDERTKELTERFTCRIHTVIDEMIPWDLIVSDIMDTVPYADDEEPEEELPQEPEEAPVPPQEEEVPDFPQSTNSTEPVAQSPGGSQTFNITPNLNPPKIEKLEEQNLFDDAPTN